MNEKLFRKINIAIEIFGIAMGILLFIFARYYIQGSIVNSAELSVGGFMITIMAFIMNKQHE